MCGLISFNIIVFLSNMLECGIVGMGMIAHTHYIFFHD